MYGQTKHTQKAAALSLSMQQMSCWDKSHFPRSDVWVASGLWFWEYVMAYYSPLEQVCTQQEVALVSSTRASNWRCLIICKSKVLKATNGWHAQKRECIVRRPNDCVLCMLCSVKVLASLNDYLLLQNLLMWVRYSSYHPLAIWLQTGLSMYNYSLLHILQRRCSNLWWFTCC